MIRPTKNIEHTKEVSTTAKYNAHNFITNILDSGFRSLQKFKCVIWYFLCKDGRDTCYIPVGSAIEFA